MKIYRFEMTEYWYDPSTRCWWCREIDSEGNQIGDAENAYTKSEIVAIVTNWRD